MAVNRQIVVITPIRNEEWVLDDFLRVTSSFADYIVIGDHLSTDNSVRIATSYPKVKLFQSGQQGFSERERRNELLEEARKLGNNNVILSLDADEFLSPSFISEENIRALKSLPIGTRIKLPFYNLRPDLLHYWEVPLDPVGFVDDGAIHNHTAKIHFPRIPWEEGQNIYEFPNAGLVHLQYLDWARMESKHRWYRAWERINFPDKTPLDIQRRYSHMYGVPRRKLKNIHEELIPYYTSLGVNFEALRTPKESYWWDDETLRLIEQNGKNKFRYIDLEPQVSKSHESLKDFLYWKYLDLTTPLTGLGKYSPLRLSVRLIDSLTRYFWI